MRNTSAGYLVCGVLIGVTLSKASMIEPAWFFLLIPAAFAFIAAITVDHSTP